MAYAVSTREGGGILTSHMQSMPMNRDSLILQLVVDQDGHRIAGADFDSRTRKLI